MNKTLRSIFVVFITLALGGAVFYFVGGKPRDGSLAATENGAEASSTLESEMQQLMKKVKDKLAKGTVTEADLAEELKSFDTIVAAHKNEQTEDVAGVLLAKAALYIEVLENIEKGVEVLKKIQSDFPKTKSAANVTELLPELENQIEMQKRQAALKPGVQFPGFDEKDLKGESLSITKYRGKVVLVDFWATWCGPCVMELPNVLAAYKKFHDKGFEVIGISLDSDEAALKEFIAQKQIPWPQYFDGLGWKSKLGQKYGITGIPATYLLDREGKIVSKGLRGEELMAELEKLLGK